MRTLWDMAAAAMLLPALRAPASAQNPVTPVAQVLGDLRSAQLTDGINDNRYVNRPRPSIQ
jgi:hypothetical protein